MGAPSITYTFSNSTTADATQVNQNFTDIINGITDGTKDLSISALTCAGNVSLNGTVTLGNASGDDITVTGSLASSIPIKTTNTYNIGSSTLGLASIYFGANSQTVRILPSASMSATWTFTLPVSAGTDGYFLKTNGSGVSSWSEFTPMTIQRFTTGSGNYTTPAGVKYIVVKMIGSGAGGSGGHATTPVAGSNGNNTTFGASLTAGAGQAATSATGGIGGTNSISGSWVALVSVAGGQGQGAGQSATALTYFNGAMGGASVFSAGPGAPGAAAATAAASNSGAGGGGGGAPSGGICGPGGGAGGYVEAMIIPTAGQVFAYSVGAGGSGGSSTHNGGTGGSGVIVVMEFYQ